MKKHIFFFSAIIVFSNIVYAQLSLTDVGKTIDQNVYNISLADINNDGFIDMYASTNAMTNASPGKIWLNDSTGNFIAKQTIGTNGIMHSVAFADLNNDGFKDIFLRNDASYLLPNSGTPNEVWLNDGNGNFTKTNQTFDSKPSRDVLLADFDGNGTVDALVLNYHGADDTPPYDYFPHQLWLNDSTGTFTLSSQTLGSGMTDAYLSDIDLDNDTDVIFEDSIWLNNGKGIFTNSGKTSWDSSDDLYLKIGDLNNDNYPDVIVGKRNQPDELWLNNGSGQFSKSGQILGDSNITFSIEVFDVDNDNDMDLFFGYFNKPGALFINQGNEQGGNIATFQVSENIYPSGNAIIADLNNDSIPDAIINNKIYTGNITSITDSLDNKDFIIYPNPTNGIIYINAISGKNANISATIYDLSGKELTFCNSYISGLNSIDLSAQKPGIYIARILFNGKESVQKIVIEQ